MTRQTDDADVVGKIFTAKLCAETELFGLSLELFFKFAVTESVAQFVAMVGQRIEIFHRGLLHNFEIFFSRSAADHDGDVIGRTCGCAEALHFLHKEGDKSLRIEYGFGLLIEICLVGRAAAFGHEEKFVFVTLGGMDVNLRGEVAAGVYLVIHCEGGVLRVAQVVSGICDIDALRDALLVVTACVDVLAFLAVADGRAGVLAEGELALGGHLGVAEHGEGYKLVVLGCFGIGEYLGHHLVVLATEHECVVMGTCPGKHGESLWIYYEKLMASPVFDLYIVGSEFIIFGCVGSQREHRLILKRFCSHYAEFMLLLMIYYIWCDKNTKHCLFIQLRHTGKSVDAGVF